MEDVMCVKGIFLFLHRKRKFTTLEIVFVQIGGGPQIGVVSVCVWWGGGHPCERPLKEKVDLMEHSNLWCTISHTCHSLTYLRSEEIKKVNI